MCQNELEIMHIKGYLHEDALIKYTAWLVTSIVCTIHICSITSAFIFLFCVGIDFDWMKYVNNNIRRWIRMTNYWIITWGPSHSLHVVKYEDLVVNNCREVSKILRFIGVHVDEDDIRDKLQDGYR